MPLNPLYRTLSSLLRDCHLVEDGFWGKAGSPVLKGSRQYVRWDRLSIVLSFSFLSVSLAVCDHGFGEAGEPNNGMPAQNRGQVYSHGRGIRSPV